jgi:hypothetical protein
MSRTPNQIDLTVSPCRPNVLTVDLPLTEDGRWPSLVERSGLVRLIG